MNNQQSNSTQLVLTIDATGSDAADALDALEALEALGFEQIHREHKDAFGCPVSVP
jgi:hypothetical protein